MPADASYPGDDVVDYIGSTSTTSSMRLGEERWNTFYVKAPSAWNGTAILRICTASG